jgi:hypothetical protein
MRLVTVPFPFPVRRMHLVLHELNSIAELSELSRKGVGRGTSLPLACFVEEERCAGLLRSGILEAMSLIMVLGVP